MYIIGHGKHLRITIIKYNSYFNLLYFFVHSQHLCHFCGKNIISCARNYYQSGGTTTLISDNMKRK